MAGQTIKYLIEDELDDVVGGTANSLEVEQSERTARDEPASGSEYLFSYKTNTKQISL